jgi:hypothetical protein
MTKPKTWGAKHAAKAILLGLLMVPAAVALLPGDAKNTEHRRSSPTPALPHSLPEALKYPGQLDAWVNDNFGLRASLLTLHNRIRFSLFGQFPTVQVISGKDGRIFLSAHQKTDPPYSAIFSSFGYQIDPAPAIADQVNQFSALTRERGLDAKLLIVPSSSVVHADQLPDWLRTRVDPASIPTLKVLASSRLEAAARNNLYFPYQEMRAEAARMDLFPKTWFHWMGDGPRTVAGLTMERFWSTGRDQGVPLATKIENMPSDLSHLFPGIELSSPVRAIDYQASGVEACFGPTCLGEALRPTMEKLWQMSTYRNPRAPRGRLVIVSDSFGQPVAGWYSRYYKEVVHVCTNLMDELSEQELRPIRSYLFDEAKGGDVLFLYHDVTVHAGRIRTDTALLLPPSSWRAAATPATTAPTAAPPFGRG